MREPSIKEGSIYETNDGGRVIVLEYLTATCVKIKHLDEYGYEMFTRADHIKEGAIRNPFFRSVYGVGYLGVGRFHSRENGKQSISYKYWCRMLERCYCDNADDKFPTHVGCSVHEKWHNFQNFSEWFYDQEFGDRYHLDKDIVVKGNMVYSEDTCCLVPSVLNAIINEQTNRRGVYPQGVRKCNSKYEARLRSPKKGTMYLGVYDTPELAFQAYRKKKKEVISEIAHSYRNRISEKAFEALIDYEPSEW